MKRTLKFWTKEEDAKLLKLVNDGHRLKNEAFEKIAKIELPDRTINSIRFRYYSVLAKNGSKPTKVVNNKIKTSFNGLNIESYSSKVSNIVYNDAIIRVGNNILKSKQIEITHV